MKRLMILRHAKAVSEDAAHEDKLRKLNERGQQAAEMVGWHIAGTYDAPELVRCSAAERTEETLERVLPHLKPHPEVHIEERLYHATAGDLLTIVHETDDNYHSLMLVGHNPGSHILALNLAAPRDPGYDTLRYNFPTAALAVLEFPDLSRWAELELGSGRIRAFITPKMLEDGI